MTNKRSLHHNGVNWKK